MILEYHRPQDLDAAIRLINRSEPVTYPLGGGTVLSRPGKTDYAVVDLQSLPINQVESLGNQLSIGATVTLQRLLERPETPDALRVAIHQEASINQRQVATIAGTLVSSTGRSPFAAAMMALDARLTWLPGEQEIGLGDWLPLRASHRPGTLISKITVPLNTRLVYRQVARTPDDWPLICIAAARWPSGRTRVVVGGFGAASRLALDGQDPEGVEAAVGNATSDAGDEWASAEYCQSAAMALARRGLNELEVR